MKKAFGPDIDKTLKMRNQQTPTGKMGDAWDIAYAAAFLASDESRYINGVLLPVDGGLSCQIKAPEWDH